MMKKTILSLFALTAFAVTFAGTTVGALKYNGAKWIYTGETEPIEESEPDCDNQTPPECARLHVYDEELEKWVPLPGDENARFGERITR